MHCSQKAATSPCVRRMVSVYRDGQPRDTAPAYTITREQARWWLDNGSAMLRDSVGAMGDRGRVLVLSKPMTMHLQLRSSLGSALIFRYLRGDKEAIALVQSFAPNSSRT